MSRKLGFTGMLIDYVVNPVRKTVKTPVELIDTPIEIDRALLAYGYLDLQKYTGKSLVKVNSD